MNKDVIIACDFPDADTTLKFLEQFGDLRPFVKIGMELYYGAGPDIVRRLRERGHRIFLDLKLHDIPNTVRKSMKVLAGMDIDMINVHAGGTIEMMAAGLQGLEEGTPQGRKRPLLIAVTQLTSTSPEALKNQLLIDTPMNETIAKYAQNAKAAGLDGVVCSPLEASIVKEACGPEFLTVTPGIRYPNAGADDQSRVTTPERAREIGSDFIVVGRPITAAPDPVAAYLKARKEFAGI